MKQTMTTCMALYDFPPEKADMKRFFTLMEELSARVNVPWESMGLTTGRKLVQFKNGKRKVEKTNFEGISDISLMGGVEEPGTNAGWRTYAFLDADKRGHMVLCIEHSLWEDTNLTLKPLLQDLLTCAPFGYGIVYERDRDLGPEWYSVGVLSETDRKRVPTGERKQISSWAKAYCYGTNRYRTGLLRDVYAHNVVTSHHLAEKVGGATLEEWIKSSPTHGSLTPLTDTHLLWSLDPQHIPWAQEVLQQAGLLLCHKP